MTWLSEKNDQGKTGGAVVKDEFARVGKGLATAPGAIVVASLSVMYAAAFAVAFPLASVLVTQAKDDFNYLAGEASYFGTLADAYDKTDVKGAAQLGAVGGALTVPLMIPMVIFASSRKKWAEGNAPTHTPV